MNSHANTLARQADWTPASQASKPDVVPPHPPLQSGGWYRGTVIEMPGPGRPPVLVAQEKVTWVAVVLAVLFGPLGLCYASAKGGLLATVLTVAVLGYAEAGFLPLVLLWPLAVAVAPALLALGRRSSIRTTPVGRR
ncbi:MAG: hypothetical protein WBA97_38095 [Actinophytocola sp.]|uniref:hypothetical protein n=1 Tax=Actinophytocola sp. TaxID=1872138 RepID=UPI003C711D4E